MKKIAILDDYPDFCVVMECLLGNYFEVCALTDTNIFLEKVKSETYSLVLVDLTIQPIPELKINNGCDVIHYLKQNLKQPPLLILFTGWVARNAVVEGKKICPFADGCLAKDADIEQILEEINKLIASRPHSAS